MIKPKSEWQTKELSQAFLEGMRGAIPGADLQLAVISKVVQRWSTSPKRIMDLGCGNGILGQFLLKLFPSASSLFLDFSDPMIDAAIEKVSALPNTTVAKADFASPQWLDVARPQGEHPGSGRRPVRVVAANRLHRC